MYQKTGQSVSPSYETIYFSMWEMGQRYGKFTKFRVMGESHDQRMIPALEIGEGEEVIFCISGIRGTENVLPGLLVKLSEEYCKAYECGWLVDEFYEVKTLLDKIRICMIPLLNPDGYEICQNGWISLRNPIYRQMLRMQGVSEKEFQGNGRGIDIKKNFPTLFYTRTRIGREPGSENETKALIHLLQDYRSRGLLSFSEKQKKAIHYCHTSGIIRNKRSCRLARHLHKYSVSSGEICKKEKEEGSLEQFYAERMNEPSLEIEIPVSDEKKNGYRDLRLLPLEYIFSLDL